MSDQSGLANKIFSIGVVGKSGESKTPKRLNELKGKYRKLSFIHDLHKQTVRHYLHDVMSPLSAASGYLELLKANSGSSNPEPENIQRYSQKIEEGLNEVAFIVEQLHDMFRIENEAEEDLLPELDINWLAGEVTEIACSSEELNASSVKLHQQSEQVHVEADLFQLKLIIYNMVKAADQFTTTGSTIEIETSEEDGNAVLKVGCRGEAVENNEFVSLFEKSKRGVGSNAGIGEALDITHKIASQIGGTISLEATEGVLPSVSLIMPLSGSNEVTYF